MLLNRKGVKAGLLLLPIALFSIATSGFLDIFTPGAILAERGDILSSIGIYKVSKAVPVIFILTLYFLIFYKGKIDRYRSIIFIIMALALPFDFLPHAYESRGSLDLESEVIICGEIPVCFIVIPQVLIPLIGEKVSIFAADILNIVAGALAVLAFALSLGRGFCSWVCFWGGWEEGCSKIAKKPKIKLPKKIKHIPFAILAATVLTSMGMFTATYCIWICPFKAVSEFFQVTSALVVFQTILFFTLFIGLCIVLPILSKKRTQCISLCPMGAALSLSEKINWMAVRVDKKSCSGCKKCIKECPMSAITEESLNTGKVLSNCVKCGKCMDICSKKAVNFQLKGVKQGKFKRVSKYLYLYIGMIVMSVFAFGQIFNAVSRILTLITTGSILY